MTTSKVQGHIDSAGRLAAIMDDLHDDEIHMLDVLAWCEAANVVLANDTKTPLEAYKRIAGEVEL